MKDETNNFSIYIYILVPLILYVICLYLIPNWFVWNFIFEGRFFGLLFIIGIVSIFSMYLIDLYKISFLKSIPFLILSIIISIILFNLSIYIGNYQINSKLFYLKNEVDSYKLQNGNYPLDIKEMKQAGIKLNTSLPLFIKLSGKIQYELKENKQGYTIDINAIENGGDLGMYIDEKGKIERYDM